MWGKLILFLQLQFPREASTGQQREYNTLGLVVSNLTILAALEKEVVDLKQHKIDKAIMF